MSDGEDDLFDYNVVRNDEEQYSIWFADEDPPAGWTIVPIPAEWSKEYFAQNSRPERGNKAECLAYISEIWTDMRPKSLREAMAADT